MRAGAPKTSRKIATGVMAGLVPAIHVLLADMPQGVDTRHKAGHDELCGKALFLWLLFEPVSKTEPADYFARRPAGRSRK